MVARLGWWFSEAGFFVHINAYKTYRPATRMNTGLAGGPGRPALARSMTGLAADGFVSKNLLAPPPGLSFIFENLRLKKL
jgi:hypothetical protein